MDNITWIQSFWNLFLGVSNVRRENNSVSHTKGWLSCKQQFHLLIVTSPLTPRSCSNLRGIWGILESWHLQIRLLLYFVVTHSHALNRRSEITASKRFDIVPECTGATAIFWVNSRHSESSSCPTGVHGMDCLYKQQVISLMAWFSNVKPL